MTTATSMEPRFLYPQSRQFPFDEVCEQIVRALEERNWSVPGITVDFDVYGTGDEKYRLVRHIKGDDFKLWFCRPQALMGRWNDTAAVTGSSSLRRSSTSTTTNRVPRSTSMSAGTGKRTRAVSSTGVRSIAGSTASRAGTSSTTVAATAEEPR